MLHSCAGGAEGGHERQGGRGGCRGAGVTAAVTAQGALCWEAGAWVACFFYNCWFKVVCLLMVFGAR